MSSETTEINSSRIRCFDFTPEAIRSHKRVYAGRNKIRFALSTVMLASRQTKRPRE